jgi:hypothetical protein
LADYLPQQLRAVEPTLFQKSHVCLYECEILPGYGLD